ncbi:MAG: HAD hydrolase-like protein [Gemmatimonadota bacterium]|nr:HAD hydrolase-like protein [Gemmatimonadota bacterium]
MPEPRLRAIVLDFDGVIVESNSVKEAAFESIFARYPAYYEMAMQFHRANVSLSRFDKFRHLACAMGEEDGALVATLADEFSSAVAQSVSDAPPVAGAVDFLEEFGPGTPLYLASVTPQEELERILAARGLRKHFKRIFGYPPVLKADALRAVIDCESAIPAEILMIGDSQGDERAAREVGTRFIARDSGLPLPDGVAKFADMNEVAFAVRQLMNGR